MERARLRLLHSWRQSLTQNHDFQNRETSASGTFCAVARKYYNNRTFSLAAYVLTLAPSGYTLEFTDD
jgi:hypothetical protein